VSLDILDPDAPLLYHQQALSHTLRSGRGVPGQVVFPDATMAIGSPPTPLDAVATGPTPRPEPFGDGGDDERGNGNGNGNSASNSAVVVYTSVSDPRVVVPRVSAYGTLLVAVVAAQAILAVCILTGATLVPFHRQQHVAQPTHTQEYVYGVWLLVSAGLPVAAWLKSADFLKLYSTVATAAALAALFAAMNSLLDVAWCLLCIPSRYLCSEIRKVSIPHCFLMHM
jgi:hypothetical protein